MKYKLFSAVAMLVVFATVIIPGHVDAQKDSSKVDGGLISQSYDVDAPLQTGTVVQLDESDSTKVIAATNDRLNKAFGVVVSLNTLPINVTDGSAGQVIIGTSGKRSALVTNENGAIKAGDYLAISSLNGTLMKARDDQSIVFGTANADFDGKNNLISKTALKSADGKSAKEVGVGMIQVSISIMRNPEEKVPRSDLPKALQRIAFGIAGKPVSAVKVYISISVMVLSLAIAGVLLYAGTKGSLISIGRNPLSKKSILRAMIQVVLSATLVLIIGLFTVYLLLRL